MKNDISDTFLKIGNNYKNFTVTNYQYIDEINSSLIELTHTPTNAKVMHIANDDLENLFCLSFQTIPYSSNGIAHVLEHTVLCGSDKFPIKDPFFSMIRRSLNTFMNAFTGSDFTCYPASSETEKDFYNLLEVYADSVFHPKLNELSFLQEGHRLEYQDIEDSTSPLLFKGIVYNEMKGAMTSSDDRLWHTMLEKLTPDLTYAYNSGGAPKNIPDLSYEELIAFHQKYYHPSHCLFFFYGNIATEKHLDFLEKNILKDTKMAPPIPPLEKQKRFKSPVNYTSYFPIAKNEELTDKDIIAFGFLTCNISNSKEVLALNLIDSILSETDASPLKLELLKSGLCNQIETYLDTDMPEVPWIVVCKGTKSENKDKIFDVILKTLNTLIKEKIPNELIEAAMHQLEFTRSEITGGSHPYGLTLFMRAALSTQHGCKSENELRIHSLFEELNNDMKDPNYLTNIIEKYMIENPHVVKLDLRPDPALEAEEENSEKETLEKINKTLTATDKKNIISKAIELQKYQEKLEHQSIECLPKIEINEIPERLKYFSLNKTQLNNFNIYHHSCFTNKILYVDLIFNLPEIDKADLTYLSLFTSLFTEVGCKDRDYKENLKYINSYLGDFSCYITNNTSIKDTNMCFPSLAVRGRSLYRNSEKLFAIFKDMITSVNFENIDRIKELLMQQYTIISQTINQAAMSYAINDSLSSFTLPSYISNQLHGIPYFEMLKIIVKDIDVQLPIVIKKMQELKQKVFSVKTPDLIVSCDLSFYENLKDNSFYSITDIPLYDTNSWQNNIEVTPDLSPIGKIIASPVAFTSAAYKTVGIEHIDSPYLFLATSIFENKFLHPEIREKGGAYGSGATYNPSSGSFYFYSYRDPHLNETLNTFESSIKEIAKGNFSARDIEEAILEAIQDIDAPLSPGKRAISTYYFEKSNKTKLLRETFRKSILKADKKKIQDAIKNHLYNQIEKVKIVSYSGEDFLKKENTKLKKMLSIQSI